MARLPRLTLAHHLHHIVQKGNNGQPIFLDDADFRQMVALLGEQSRLAGVSLHSYALMDSQLQLLATPETDSGIPTLMQSVGRAYVRYFNDRHGRSGTLWDGRYRSTLVQADRFLLDCMVAIDTLPVVAGIADEATDYPWSSCRHYAGRGPDRLVTPHALYWAIGNTPFAREQAYAELVAAGISADLRHGLMRQTQQGWALGDPGFLGGLERAGARRPTPRRAGRPKKVILSPNSF